MKLLIVDDSMIIRRMIERNLDQDLFESVETASNGAIAVEKFRASSFDVVTMDITMPELDGLSCIDELLKLKPDARILVISALADRSTAVEAVKRGAQGFLLKPFTPEDLHTALRETLED